MKKKFKKNHTLQLVEKMLQVEVMLQLEKLKVVELKVVELKVLRIKSQSALV